MTIILHEQDQIDCPSAQLSGGALWLSAGDLERATGWSLKPEGFCKGDVCVPVPPAKATNVVGPAGVNLVALWEHLDCPLAHDDKGEVWVLGNRAADRAMALQSLSAPDFTLPDLDGRPTAFSSLRGKKVLLATWASW